MSPEQARGKPVDKRADVWAFGALLYEMLTGRRLFGGETVSDVLAAVLMREPDWAALPASTPAPVRRLIARCLDRDPRKRLRDVGEARLLLEAPLAGEAAPAASPGRPLAGRVGWAVAAVLAVAAAALGWRVLAPAPRPPLLRFTISSASGAAIDAAAGSSAISPDGRRVVFVGTDTEGKQGLWIQELDQVRARLLAGTGGASYPFWAPDSRRVAFFAKGKLHKVSLADGRVEAICDAMEARGGSWGRTGTIVFAPAVYGVLSAVPEGGGTPTPATRIENPKEEISHRFPAFLPDGRRFLYVADPGGAIEEGRVYLASLDGGERRLLYRSRRAPIYAEPGYLIDAIDDRLVARPFDPEAGELRGEPRRLEEATPPYVHTQDRVASVSASGALLVPLLDDVGTKVLWLDRRGRLVGEVPLPRGTFVSPRLAPDGRRLAISSQGPRESESDLWVVDLASEQASRLTFAPGHERYPVWSPDGLSLAFQTDRGGAFDLWLRPSSGSGAERVLHESPTAWKIPQGWVGGTLAFGTAESETGFDVWLLRPDRPTGAPGAPPPLGRERGRCRHLPRRALARLRLQRVGPRGGLRRVVARCEGQVPGDDAGRTAPRLDAGRARAALPDGGVLGGGRPGHSRRVADVRNPGDALPAPAPQLGRRCRRGALRRHLGRQPRRGARTGPPGKPDAARGERLAVRARGHARLAGPRLAVQLLDEGRVVVEEAISPSPRA